MSKIRKDKHSLYVKAGGYIFRPTEAKYTYLTSTETRKAIEEGTKYKDGDDVKARHISQSPHGKVGDEFWCSHGCYYVTDADDPRPDGSVKKTEECWCPMTYLPYQSEGVE